MLGAIDCAKVEACQIDEIVVGTAKQTSLPSNCARHAALLAKLPDNVPAYTVQRQSASGLQAIANGFWSIGSGNAEIILAGGTESMTLAPREIHDARYVFNNQTRIIFDPFATQLEGAQPVEQYGKLTLELLVENLTKKYGLSKVEMADFAAGSLEKAKSSGGKAHLLPLAFKKGKVTGTICQDELYSSPRDIAGAADAAAMCLLTSRHYAEKMSLAVLGEILAVGISAGDPAADGLVGTQAVTAALKNAGLTMRDIGLIEINELSAAQCLVCSKELQALGLTQSQISAKVNVGGGALATGSAWGAAGAVLFADLIHRLRENNVANGLIVVPAEGGQTMAMVIRAQ